MKKRVASVFSTLIQSITCLLLCCVLISLTVIPSSALADGFKCQNGLDGGCQELTEVVGDGVLLAQAPDEFYVQSNFTGECLAYATIRGYAWTEPCNGTLSQTWKQLPGLQMMAYDGSCLKLTPELFLDSAPCEIANPWFFLGDNPSSIMLNSPASNQCLTAKADYPGYSINDCNGQPSSLWNKL